MIQRNRDTKVVRAILIKKLHTRLGWDMMHQYYDKKVARCTLHVGELYLLCCLNM